MFLTIDGSDGIVGAVDHELAATVGAEAAELVGRPWGELFHRSDHPAMRDGLADAGTTGAGAWTARLRRRGGDVILTQCNAAADTTGQTLYVIVRDTRAIARRYEDLWQYARLSDLVEDVLVVTDGRGCIVTLNRAAERLHSTPREQMIGRHLGEFVAPEGAAVLERIALRALAGETVIDFRMPVEDAGGNLVWMEGLTTYDAETQRFYTVQRNMTERVNRERELEIGHRFFDLSAAHLALIDEDGLIRRANPALKRFLGRSDAELLGTPLNDAMGFVERDVLDDARAEALGSGVPASFSAELVVGDRPRTVSVSVTASTDRRTLYYSGRDVTEEERLSAALLDRATTDQLTRLATRQVFGERLEAELTAGQTAGVVMLDLDDFKRINDALGHAAGDELLSQIGRRLTATVRSSDLVARFGGDEFVVLLKDVGSAEKAVRLAERIRAAVAEPYVLAGRDCHITTSLGVAVGTGTTHSQATLLREADTAAYQAKAAGRNQTRLFDTDLAEMIARDRQVELDLRAAIQNGSIDVDVQGIFTSDGRLTALEALARLQRPDGSRHRPDTFLGVARRLGLLAPLGEAVHDRALGQLTGWLAADAGRSLNLNADPAEIAAPGFVAGLLTALDRHGVRASQLTMEVTESGLLEPGSRAADALDDLRNAGVRIAIDDFGTGASSLAYVRDLRVDELKIDRTFIESTPTNPVTRAITEALIDLAGTLGITVVAEGVETGDQLHMVRQLGCPLVQGYLLHRPQPVAEFLATDRSAASLQPGG
ncbi:MAG: EAL domain-containing protein [Actinomycetota bacterium]